MAVALAFPPSVFSRVWAKYERALQRRPVLTQAVSSAVLWGLGDGMAQRIETRGRGHVDLRRVALTAAFGGALIGPIGHVWYTALEAMVRRMGLECATRAMLLKVTVDNLLYSPAYVLSFFAYGCMAIDGLSPAAFAAKMREEFLPTMLTEALLWPPYMAAVFLRVPVKHQLLAVNVATLFDVCFLSWVRTKHEQQQPQQQPQLQQLAAAASQKQQRQKQRPQPQPLHPQQQEQAPPRSAGEARRRELSACLWDAAPEPSLGRMALMAASATMAPHGGGGGGGGVRRSRQE